MSVRGCKCCSEASLAWQRPALWREVLSASFSIIHASPCMQQSKEDGEKKDSSKKAEVDPAAAADGKENATDKAADKAEGGRK